ncbi:MAG: NAD(P)H-dependent oxidoreductase [Bacteroidota bacterium]
MKKILLINAHPWADSYNYALAEAYERGVSQTNAQLEVIRLAERSYNPNMIHRAELDKPIEPDIQDGIDKVRWSDHLVWVFPIWWYGYPALMKGFIDKVFLSGVAYRYQEKSPFPERLLKGKSARMIMTGDTPYWYYRLVMKEAATVQLRKGTLMFSGIKPVRTTYLGPIRQATAEKRQAWLEKVERLGRELR